MPEPIQTPVPAADELAAQVLLLAQSRLTGVHPVKRTTK